MIREKQMIILVEVTIHEIKLLHSMELITVKNSDIKAFNDGRLDFYVFSSHSYGPKQYL